MFYYSFAEILNNLFDFGTLHKRDMVHMKICVWNSSLFGLSLSKMIQEFMEVPTVNCKFVKSFSEETKENGFPDLIYIVAVHTI